MNNEQTVPVPLTGDDYYGEGKCHVCQNDIAIKVNGRFYDKIVGDLVTGFNNGFKAARKLNANHAALVEAAPQIAEFLRLDSALALELGFSDNSIEKEAWAQLLEALTEAEPPTGPSHNARGWVAVDASGEIDELSFSEHETEREFIASYCEGDHGPFNEKMFRGRFTAERATLTITIHPGGSTEGE